MKQELNFEEAMERLGEIVKTLEGGKASLDDSILLFEEGMKLSKHCADVLEKAEQKVQILQEGNAENA